MTKLMLTLFALMSLVILTEGMLSKNGHSPTKHESSVPITNRKLRPRKETRIEETPKKDRKGKHVPLPKEPKPSGPCDLIGLRKTYIDEKHIKWQCECRVLGSFVFPKFEWQCSAMTGIPPSKKNGVAGKPNQKGGVRGGGS